MNLTMILAATAKVETSVSDALPHLVGMLLVIITLAVLWGVCAFTATLIRTFMPVAAPPAPAMAATSSLDAAGSIDEEPQKIAPEIVVVIAAAVAATTGPSHRIVSIKRQSSSWAKAGRQSVLSSHRIR